MKLYMLNEGESAYVKHISKAKEIWRRFEDLGIIAGTKIKCVLQSPAKNPKAYMIRGAVIAIRNEDASLIDIDVYLEGD